MRLAAAPGLVLLLSACAGKKPPPLRPEQKIVELVKPAVVRPVTVIDVVFRFGDATVARAAGREPGEGALVVPDPRVSRLHCWLGPTGTGGVGLVDRGSSNATFMNNIGAGRVREVQPYQPREALPAWCARAKRL